MAKFTKTELQEIYAKFDGLTSIEEVRARIDQMEKDTARARELFGLMGNNECDAQEAAWQESTLGRLEGQVTIDPEKSQVSFSPVGEIDWTPGMMEASTAEMRELAKEPLSPAEKVNARLEGGTPLPKVDLTPADRTRLEQMAMDHANALELFDLTSQEGQAKGHSEPEEQTIYSNGTPGRIRALADYQAMYQEDPFALEVEMPDDEEPEECMAIAPELQKGADYQTTYSDKRKWVYKGPREPQVELVVNYHFEAAHRLPGHKSKCIRLHGHSYRVRATCKGPIREAGVVTDFGKIKATIDRLDHRYLNDFMYHPTAENTAQWLLDRIPFAIEVRVWEGLGGCSAIARV